MFKKIFCIVIILHSLTTAYSQNHNVAILMSSNGNQNELSDLIFNKLTAHKNYGPQIKPLFYDWVESTSLKPINHDDTSPVSEIVFLDLNQNLMIRPEMRFTVDSTGKTTSAYYEVNPSMTVFVKLVDLASTEILFLEVFEYKRKTDQTLRDTSNERVYVDYKKDFTSDPAKLKNSNPKQFAVLEKQVFEKYNAEYSRKLKAMVLLFTGQLQIDLRNAISVIEKQDFKLLTTEAVDEKINRVKSDISLVHGYQKDDLIDFYQITNHGGKPSFDKISVFVISEIDSTGSTLKLGLFGNRKNLANLINEKADLVLTNNKRVLVDKINEKLNLELQNVAVKKKCINCAYYLERSLNQITTTKVLERADFEFKHFREIMKLESNIDALDDDKYYKSLGVRFLFYNDEGSLQSTDLETGRVIGSLSGESKFMGIKFTDNSSPKLIKALLQDTFNDNMEIIEVLDQSKKSIKELNLYNPYGILPGERINIYTTEDELVNGKKMARKVIVADGYVFNNITEHEGRFKIKKGGDELMEFMNNKKPLYFEYEL